MSSLLAELDRALAQRAVHGGPARLHSRPLAAGEGWWVEDLVCTAGHRDRPFEESRSHVAIALVVAGSFQYRSPAGRAVMTPGSLLFGNPGEPFECGHEHGAGDRCVSFSYSPRFVEEIASGAGVRPGQMAFKTSRLPPMPDWAPLAARACSGLFVEAEASWEELALELWVKAVRADHGHRHPSAPPPGAEARVTRVTRLIERGPDDEPFTLQRLAREAGMSRYHFLRTFQAITGATPHQYVCRTRLRHAATRLVQNGAPVIDIALDSGYGDVSNFNHAFRREFGMSPRAFRRRFS